MAIETSSWHGAWRAVRERSAVLETGAGFVVLTGAERKPYLHSLVTNRIEDLEPGRGRRAFLLTPTKGRVLADFLACETGEALWLECVGESAPAVLEILGRYYFGQDVTFRERTGEWRALSLQGPESGSILERLGVPVPPAEPGAHAAGPMSIAADGGSGPIEVRVVRWSDTGEPGFHVWAPATDAGRVLEALVEAGAERGVREAWTVLQIEAGNAVFGRELGEETIPLEAPVDDAISFDKGCYPGQEVIARLHVRGRPARRLRGLRIEGDEPLPAGAVLDAPGKPGVATVTASGVSPVLGAVALAYVQRDHVQAGTRLMTRDGREAEVVDLPMVPAHAR